MIRVLEGSEILPHPVNMQDQFFSLIALKLDKTSSCKWCPLQAVFDHTGLESHKQLVVPEDCVMKIIRTLHTSPVHGHPGSKKLHELRKGITRQV